MAFDPIMALSNYSETECSVQFWIADTPPLQFRSLKDAVTYARDHGGRWNEIEITVHLPREDIVYATVKSRILMDALQQRPRRGR